MDKMTMQQIETLVRVRRGFWFAQCGYTWDQVEAWYAIYRMYNQAQLKMRWNKIKQVREIQDQARILADKHGWNLDCTKTPWVIEDGRGVVPPRDPIARTL